MLALVAGTGALPPAIMAAFPDALICALDGFTPDVLSPKPQNPFLMNYNICFLL
jgi:hypothetical protein